MMTQTAFSTRIMGLMFLLGKDRFTDFAKLIYISHLYKKVNSCYTVTDEKVPSNYAVPGYVYGRI